MAPAVPAAAAQDAGREGTAGRHGKDTRPPGPAKQDALRWVAPKNLVIGTAVAGGGHHLSMPYPDPFSSDQEYRRRLAAEFSSVSPENQMKWDFIHPERNRYNFGRADAIVEFAEKNKQVVRGHTLLWHSQNPSWLQNGDFTDAELRDPEGAHPDRRRGLRGPHPAVGRRQRDLHRHVGGGPGAAAAAEHLSQPARPRHHRRRLPLGPRN